MLARRDWPVRNMHPQPASLVQPFSARPNHFLDWGLLDMTVPSATSVGKHARFVSRIGEKLERYVSHIRDVKSS